ETAVRKLEDRIRTFLRGPRCLSRGQPPIDELMEEWLDGVLGRDPEAGRKLTGALEFCRAKVAQADAAARLTGPERDARLCFAARAELLRDIQRGLRES